jgi:hypothetical protein
MAMSQGGNWHPVFPDENPPAWMAFVALPGGGVKVLSSIDFPRSSLLWLAQWLRSYRPRQPLASTSYVYLALGGTEFLGPADGMTSPDGVRGVGGGEGYGEPPGAVASTVADIISRAATELEGLT